MSSGVKVPHKSMTKKAGGGAAATKYEDYQEDSDNDLCSNIFKSMQLVQGICCTVICCPCGLLGAGPLKVVPEGSRAVVLRYGKFSRIVGPGTYHYNVGVEEYLVESVQVRTMDLSRQVMMTKDNVTVDVNAVVYYRIADIRKALFNVNNYSYATMNFAQSSLRTAIGENTLDELFNNRAKIAESLRSCIDEETDEWGIEVSDVEIKDLEIPPSMQRVMAAVAEATREGSAKIITAKAERQAADTLYEAAEIMAENPISLQLRWFQTLAEMAGDQNKTIIIPGELTSLGGLVGGGASDALKKAL
ncbi:PHB domain-containing protein [Balamuthia mandrillaris]